MRTLLRRGSVLGLLGGGALLGGGLMPSDMLQHWGWLILVVGFGLVTAGLLPYRKIKRLELNPNKLVMDIDHLHYLVKGVTVCTLPLTHIERLQYYRTPMHYGARVFFKKDTQTKEQGNPALFFPYFSKESLERLLF